MFKSYNKLGGTWFFLIMVGIIYLITFFFSKNIFIKALEDGFNIFIGWIWVILLIFLLIFVIDLFIDKKLILKLFKKENIVFSWIFIIVAGIMSMGPIYMWYPILNELKSKGLSNKFITGFLYNRSIKIPLIIPLVTVFGLKLVLILLPILVVFSIINGYVVEFSLNYINNKNHNKL